MFPKKAWYVACMPQEIDDKPLGRKICGESIVFYRGPEGKVAALEDFCPHRGAPLSLGSVVEGNLVCGYHGLTMGCDGKTVAMPGQRVRGFPAHPHLSRHRALRLRLGVARRRGAGRCRANCTISNGPRAPSGPTAVGSIHVNCDYRLMIDNLMDLTHETYVHATSIGQKEIDETPTKTVTEGDTVITSRHMEGIMAPPFWRMALRGNNLADDVPVDRWQICRFTPPSHVLIEVGVAHAGNGGYHADPKFKASSIVVDFITPETETSIWYFWGMARNFNPHDKALTASIREGQAKIFSEDLQMLESQQRNLLAHPERQLLKLNIDSGGVQSRKVLERILAQEQSPAPATVSA